MDDNSCLDDRYIKYEPCEIVVQGAKEIKSEFVMDDEGGCVKREPCKINFSIKKEVKDEPLLEADCPVVKPECMLEDSMTVEENLVASADTGVETSCGENSAATLQAIMESNPVKAAPILGSSELHTTSQHSQSLSASKCKNMPAISLEAKPKCVRASRKQVSRLLDYMALHHDFAAGRFVGSLGKRLHRRKWEGLAQSLNAVGPTKSVALWQRTWSDMKSKTRKKVSQLRHSHSVADNHKMEGELTPNNTKILSIVGGEIGVGEASEAPVVDGCDDGAVAAVGEPVQVVECMVSPYGEVVPVVALPPSSSHTVTESSTDERSSPSYQSTFQLSFLPSPHSLPPPPSPPLPPPPSPPLQPPSPVQPTLLPPSQPSSADQCSYVPDGGLPFNPSRHKKRRRISDQILQGGLGPRFLNFCQLAVEGQQRSIHVQQDLTKAIRGLTEQLQDNAANRRAELAVQQAELAVRQTEVAAQQAEVAARRAEVAARRAEVAARRAEVAAQRAEVAALRVEVATRRTEVANGQVSR